MDTIFDGEVPRARLALLLRHFSELKDNREPWRIVYPLQEVLLLVTCATIASCDDFDDIVAWGRRRGSRGADPVLPRDRWGGAGVPESSPADRGRVGRVPGHQASA